MSGKPGRSGRKPGTKNKTTREREIAATTGVARALATGVLPLDVIMRVMRGDTSVTDRQLTAAVAAAPYVHPRLSAVAQTTVDEIAKLSDQQLAAELARLGGTAAGDPAGDASPGVPARPADVVH